jgi:hypothetical protein
MDSKPVHFMALATLAAFAGFGFRGEQERAAPKWEYRWVILSRAAETNAEWVRWFEVSAEGSRTLAGPINSAAKVAELGEQGWELVSVTPMSNHLGGATTEGYGSRDMAGYTSQLTYYFKRAR